ncbi:MAG: EAL and GGDEF domain-containing protein [Pseudomonadales bacterium]|nr:EAL and GGDEF domain-containing protein [Pseudomonadales bacterium]MCP5344569.1 EAL and GGDEF domain-containing protein [Pseudomonadales bacterium]
MGDNIVRLLQPTLVDGISGTDPELRQEFLRILAKNNLTPLFQPIIDFQKRTILGYESLIRGPSDSALHSPATLFDIARREGALTELDIACKRKGIRAFNSKQLAGKLFLNTTPQGLLEPGHRNGLTLEFLREVGIAPENVVIELTEQYPMTDFSIMRNALEHYRLMGFEIAIDDLGAGYSGLTRWAELRPDYVKVDRHFIQNIHTDSVKQSFVRSIADIAKELQCHVIAEGIETQEECQALVGMGITFGQGYFFGRPQKNPICTIPDFLTQALEPTFFRKSSEPAHEDIQELLTPAPFLREYELLENAYQYFIEDELLTTVAVIDKNMRPIGLIRRNSLLATFSRQYGRSLHGAKPVENFMDTTFVTVEKSSSLEQVSNLVTNHMQSQIEADFIIVNAGKYLGLGKVMDLLKKITESQIRNARYANPLTLLPGNVPIYEFLDQLIENQNSFCIAYCDIDNFKPYNDVYGYFEGDKLIKLIAEILRDNIDSSTDFIGHVGGDDFIVVFTSNDWKLRCQCILRIFEERVPQFYTEKDQTLGGIYTQSREGVEQFYPLMTLSIGVVTPNTKRIISHHDVANMATHAKHMAKKIRGNSLYVEQRPC